MKRLTWSISWIELSSSPGLASVSVDRFGTLPADLPLRPLTLQSLHLLERGLVLLSLHLLVGVDLPFWLFMTRLLAPAGSFTSFTT